MTISKKIDALKDVIEQDPAQSKLMNLLNELDEILEADSDDENRKYRLPYSSTPIPTGERWKSA